MIVSFWSSTTLSKEVLNRKCIDLWARGHLSRTRGHDDRLFLVKYNFVEEGGYLLVSYHLASISRRKKSDGAPFGPRGQLGPLAIAKILILPNYKILSFGTTTGKKLIMFDNL